VNYADFLEKVRSYQDLAEITDYGQVIEGGSPYPLVRLTVPGERWLVITAGFHGEEPAGPLTLAEHLPDLIAYARARNVGLRVYPCINPSGFERGTRYNASGEKPNNDFLRYEVEPGVWKGELVNGTTFVRHVTFHDGPKETRALVRELEALPTPAAAIDIHQDNYMQGAWSYAYVFGDKGRYVPFVRQSASHTQIAHRCAVDEHNKTDENGLVVFHDGSVTDYFLRRGVPYTAALETTTQTPMARCFEVNRIWIRGFIDLAAAP
jgi:hypothetical protein